MKQSSDAVISGKGVTVAANPVIIGDTCLPPPKVSVIRSNGDVTAIEIRCSCGETMILNCEYESAAGAGT